MRVPQQGDLLHTMTMPSTEDSYFITEEKENKKDYQLITRVLLDAKQAKVLEPGRRLDYLLDRFGDALARENPRFDRDKFRVAVLGEEA